MSNASSGASIIPALRYEDAPAAIDWLCKAFGFEKQAVYEGENGTIAHAQLTLGNGMIMLGSATETEYGKLVEAPGKNRAVTQGIYVVVPEVDKHYGRAKAAGAEIVIDIKDEDYGGRDYTARDPEGHVWTFGSYDPWAT